MPDDADTVENEAPPAGPGDDNNETKGGSSTKSKSAKRREQAQRKKTCEAAAAAAATTAAPTLSLFVGDDPDLPALDWTANITGFYSKFEKEMARHAGKTEPLMSTVVETGDDIDAITAVKARFGAKPPAAQQTTEGVEVNALNAAEQLCWKAELWEYRARLQNQIKAENSFKVESCKFYNVTMGQLVHQSLQALPDFDRDVKATKSLGKLFAALDQIVLGNEKDKYPAMTALKHFFALDPASPRSSACRISTVTSRAAWAYWSPSSAAPMKTRQ